MTNREQALAALRVADNRAGDGQPGEYATAMALIGVGHALLAVADEIQAAIEEAT